jgi:hypothetical protein
MDDVHKLNGLNSKKLCCTTEEACGVQDFVWLTGLPDKVTERYFVHLCVLNKTAGQVPPSKRNVFYFTWFYLRVYTEYLYSELNKFIFYCWKCKENVVQNIAVCCLSAFVCLTLPPLVTVLISDTGL